jgi:hypothetical protein
LKLVGEGVKGGTEVLKKGVEVLGETAKETTKETVKTIGGGYTAFIVLGVVFLFLLFRYLKSRQK